MIKGIILLVVLILILIAIVSSVKVVNTGYVSIIERFGQYSRTLQPGWHFIIPFADYMRRKVSTKQQILDIEPQAVITKDNVKISIDNVIFFRILNPKDAIYNIEDYRAGIIFSTITNMRNIVGDMTLDEVLSGRDKINAELLKVVDDITDAYGIKILSVEIKNIIPPTEIQQAMEKQMRAERDKRAVILQAEGQKQSQIAMAEGEKEANIRRAEGFRQSQILEAEGKARAIEEVAKADAKAINLVNRAIIDSGTDEKVIALKQIEALKEMAKNPANKLILPNESISSLGNMAAIADILQKDSPGKVVEK
ncbi:SPFH domain-containing protein [Clostridium sp. LBM24168]